VKLLYFAWVRERIGAHEEDFALPAGVATVGDLIAHLAARGDGYAHAFADPAQIRAAVNQETAQPGDAVADGDEVAFFPPMTGGTQGAPAFRPPSRNPFLSTDGNRGVGGKAQEWVPGQARDASESGEDQ